MNLYWGDIHNHNAVGYAKGSLERSIDIAQNSMDFYAFTGHAQWHDIQKFESNVHMHWINGFKVHTAHWDKTVELLNKAYKPGEFTTFIGYEWHSSRFGDYCLYFPTEKADLRSFSNIEQLREYVSRVHGMMIPHHMGYKQGNRGFNMSVFKENYSPLIEIFSEHGACEADEGLYEMISHSNGPRCSQNTAQAFLAAGHRAGFTASTDDHLGYPGAYGEGLTGVYAEGCTREDIWKAFQERRTYAVTGDRIRIEFSVNDTPMGGEADYNDEREIRFKVEGWDELSKIELIRNNSVIKTYCPDQKCGNNSRYRTRLAFGWGPWNDLEIPRICDWKISLSTSTAICNGGFGAFLCGPFDEERRNKIIWTPDGFSVTSYTSRKNAFRDMAMNAVAFEIQTDSPDNVWFNLQLKLPVCLDRKLCMRELMENSFVDFVGGFPKEAFKIYRLIPENRFLFDGQFIDRFTVTNQDSFYYLRVTQKNGQMAWSSPIWINKLHEEEVNA